MKDGIQKTHAKLKEPRIQGKPPAIGNKVELLLLVSPGHKRKELLCVEPGKSLGCERKAALHRAAAAKEMMELAPVRLPPAPSCL